MSKFDLAMLVAPLSVEDFFENYWENKFVHLQHKPGYFNNVLSADAIDSYLSKQDVKPDSINLVKDGSRIAEVKWTKAVTLLDGSTAAIVNNEQLFKQYNAGATIVINSAQSAISSLAAACRTFEQAFNISVQSNIYITPPCSQGFGIHYDPHDIFLFQIKGPKTWQIYDSGEELPTACKAFCKKPVLISEFEINSGDFLYLPRGTVHQAFSSSVSTIHVNFSCKPRYGFHLIQQLAMIAENEDVFFRRTIPHGFKSEAEIGEYINTFSLKLTELLHKTSLQQLLDLQDKIFAQNQLFDFKGRLLNILRLENVSLDSVISRRSGFKYLAEHTNTGYQISFGIHKLQIPAFINPDLFFKDEPFKVKEIKGLLTNQGKLTLIREFVEAGYFQIDSVS